MEKYYPVFLQLQNVKCLVIGGGEVAARKVQTLRECGAAVTLISPRLSPSLAWLAETGEVEHLAREFRPGDLAGFTFIFAAADDPEVSRLVACEARLKGAFLNLADAPEEGDFILPAKIQQGDLVIAVSTGGKSPAMAKKIRQELQELYGPEYGELLKILGREREKALLEIKDINLRQLYFRRLAAAGLADLLKKGRSDLLENRIAEIWDQINENSFLKTGQEE